MTTAGRGTALDWRVSKSRRPDLHYAILSAGLAAAVFVGSHWIRGNAPFGDRSRAISDLGAQFVPFHALLRDLAGSSITDPLFTWELGLGVPLLPDFMTYLSSPVAWLVYLFPRDQIELALFVVTVVKLSLAAAIMTQLLLVFRRGPQPIATALGIAYATSAWVIDDGAWMPMWLDGLWFFPAACIAALWALRGERPVLGTLLVTLGWWANFYTAWMASIGAAVFLLAVIAAEATSLRRAAAAFGRFASRGIVGVLLISVVLLPTYLGAVGAQEAPTGEFSRKPWSLFAARTLPLTEGALAAPGLFVSTAALVGVGGLVAQRSETVRTRAVWLTTLLLVVLSMQVPLTQSAWHGFDRPNGGAFRETFVVTGLLVLVAWIAVARDPGAENRRLQAMSGLVGLVGVVGVAAATGTGRAELHAATVPLATAAGLAAAGLLFIARPRWPLLAGGAVLLLVCGEMLANAVAIDSQRTGFLRYATWSVTDSRTARATGEEAMSKAWPLHRVSLGENVRANGPALYDVAGMSYYSSSMPRSTAEALTTVGLGWTSFGRGMAGTTDPGVTPLLSIAEALDAPGADALPPALPMIRPLSGHLTSSSTPFETRNLLYGAAVYTRPVSGSAGRAITIRCPEGSWLQAWAPTTSGTWTVNGTPSARQSSVRSAGSQETRPGVQTLVRSDGTGVDVQLHADPPTSNDPVTLSCLQSHALDELVSQTPLPESIEVRGSKLSASWKAPTQQVIIATAYSDGWSCGEAQTRSSGGWLVIDLAGESSLECRFVPKGLVPGAALSSVALVLLVGASLFRRFP